MTDETSKHIFWNCTQWSSIRNTYPKLMRFFHLVGTQWPNCFLHCGWVEQDRDYGFHLLDGLQIMYNLSLFVVDTHNMYLQSLLSRHELSKVLSSTPHTPPNLSLHPSSPLYTAPSFVQIQDDASPISISSSEPG